EIEPGHDGNQDQEDLGQHAEAAEQIVPGRGHLSPSARPMIHPATTAITTRTMVHTNGLARRRNKIAPSTIRLWQRPNMRASVVISAGESPIPTIAARAAYNETKRPRMIGSAADPGRPNTPIAGASLAVIHGNTGVCFSNVTNTNVGTRISSRSK